MKLLNFLGAIGLMLGATTNIHNIRPNFLKSQSRQVQRANQEYFDLGSKYSITMDYIQTSVFNSYDYVIFDLQNGDLWQSDNYLNKSSWVQEDISDSMQALFLNDYNDYLINKDYSYDYIEMYFNFSLGSQAQFQDNYLNCYLFTFDNVGNFYGYGDFEFNYLSPNSSSSIRSECVADYVGLPSLQNLYLALEYWSPDSRYGNIRVSFDTDLYVEDVENGVAVSDILDNSYNYFMFTNNRAAFDSYQDGYDKGFQHSQIEIENLQMEIQDLERELQATQESANVFEDLWMEAEYRISELENIIDSSKALQSTFEILTQAFDPVIEFFKIQITPNINIGSILLIPVSVAIILFLLKALIL